MNEDAPKTSGSLVPPGDSPVKPGELAPAPLQLALPGAEEMFAEAGLETLPLGVSELNARQLRFAIALLATGNKAEAARTAGFSEDNVRNLLKNTALLRFLNAAKKTVAKNGDLIVQHRSELHAQYITELNRLRSIPYEQRTEKDLRRESQVAGMALRNDALLLMALHRLGIHLSGDLNLNSTSANTPDFVVIPPDALPGMAAARQEVAATNRLTQGRN